VRSLSKGKMLRTIDSLHRFAYTASIAGVLLVQAFAPTAPAIANDRVALTTTERDIEPELRALLRQSIEQADSFQDRFDAEVWLVQKSGRLAKYVKDPAERLQILRLVHREATRAGVPPEFVLAVIEVESHFDRYAVSKAGALGMMQIMPFWKKEIGREEDNLIEVQTNLRYGCTILKYYLDRAKGNWAEALARYNGSFGYYWDYSEKVMIAWEKNWR
jgi:soluble lytic murein transglycosylase-like protein